MSADAHDGPQPAHTTNRLTVTRRSDSSLLTKVTHAVLRPIRPRLVTPKRIVSVISPRLTAPKKAIKLCNVVDRLEHDVWVHDLTPKKETPTPEPRDGRVAPRRIVYFCGGGWQMPPSGDHWALAAEMACRLASTTVSLVAYPLAPTCPASVSMPRLRKLYDTLMTQAAEKGERVIFAGDSSGGNIVLSLVTWALSEPGSLAPAAILAICPSTDLRHTHSDLVKFEKLDPILNLSFIRSTAQAWSGGGPPKGTIESIAHQPKPNFEGDWSASDPRVSPILASLAPLVEHGVKVHGVMGTYDVLAAEAILFRDRCQEEGIEGEWLEWEGQMHCFPLAFKYKFRESVEAVDWMIGVLEKN